MKKIPETQAAHAVLLLSGKYVLQLRDDIPTIAEPGKWSLFGGVLDKGEDPLSCIKREIFEELSIKPSKFKQLWFDDFYAPFEKQVIREWFFEASVDDAWNGHRLNEGKAVKVFDFNELSELKIPSIMRKTLKHYHESK
ncbi:NUDIX domain-containing protein [Candidatus Margulisiibacteriota bacterium]